MIIITVVDFAVSTAATSPSISETFTSLSAATTARQCDIIFYYHSIVNRQLVSSQFCDVVPAVLRFYLFQLFSHFLTFRIFWCKPSSYCSNYNLVHQATAASTPSTSETSKSPSLAITACFNIIWEFFQEYGFSLPTA